MTIAATENRDAGQLNDRKEKVAETVQVVYLGPKAETYLPVAGTNGLRMPRGEAVEVPADAAPGLLRRPDMQLAPLSADQKKQLADRFVAVKAGA